MRRNAKIEPSAKHTQPKGRVIERVKQLSNDTFSSLKVRNYRLFFIGQAISVSGTFMQQIAQAWLILKLTHSGTALGLVTALMFLPLLLFSSWAGLVADRVSKRRLLFATQAAYALVSFLFWVVVASGTVEVWMVYVFAFCFGTVGAFNSPVRNTFISELVEDDQVRNAVSLNSSLVSLGRVIGPAIAAVVIATLGTTPCFLINSISYGAVLVALGMMRASELHPTQAVRAAKGQVRAGFRYVLDTPILYVTVGMLALIGIFAYEFQVSLPLLAQTTFHGAATAYALLTAAMGLGAVAGGLASASSRRTAFRALIGTALLFGVAMLIAAVAPTFSWELVAMVLVGFASVSFSAFANSILQTESLDAMRGRVMSLWVIAFLGSTAIGGPIIGWIGQYASPRWGLAAGGFSALVAAAGAVLARRHLRRRTPPASGTPAYAVDEEPAV